MVATIERYFNLHGQLIPLYLVKEDAPSASSYAGVVCRGAAWAVRVGLGRTSVCTYIARDFD